MAMTYGDVKIDRENGSGSIGESTPRIPGSGASSNRHCAAWEDTHNAFLIIAEVLEKLNYAAEAELVRKYSEQSKMPLNRGK